MPASAPPKTRQVYEPRDVINAAVVVDDKNEDSKCMFEFIWEVCIIIKIDKIILRSLREAYSSLAA